MKSLLPRVSLFVLTAALLVGAIGCAKKPVNVTYLPTGKSGGAAPTDGVPVPSDTGGGRLGATDGSVRPTDFTDPNTKPPTGTDISDIPIGDKIEDRTKFASDTIFFEFDKSNVRAEFASNVSRVGDYLKGHPTESILIEGHTDERGTEEYNRALGERRALAVREKLLSMGVNTDQIATVSYGEEKPAVLGQTESAFAKNRRAEFVLLLPSSSAR